MIAVILFISLMMTAATVYHFINVINDDSMNDSTEVLIYFVLVSFTSGFWSLFYYLTH